MISIGDKVKIINKGKSKINIEAGDIVKLKKDTTLEKLTEQYWCGCQIKTMDFLKKLSFNNFNEQLEVTEANDKLLIFQKSGIEYLVRSDIFEIVRKKNILDETEKRYLKAVIRPFKDKISFISKKTYDGICYIYIGAIGDTILLPKFKEGTMYNGMEDNKNYTLKELGLDE